MEKEFNMFERSLFDKLPAWSQAEVLAKKGIALAQRQHNGWEITLYTLDNQFYERWERKGMQVVSSFQKSASVLAVLEPYTDNIDVQQLLEY
ncbi:MAG: hypothetical protein LPK07_00365 [Hymenobacteraceae bacterium]|nr:hypothetical protein [Hymenobacteraceae bacterium]